MDNILVTNCIEDKQDIADLSKIGYLYLYLAQGNKIVVDNTVTKLELQMSEGGSVYAKNLSYPDTGLLSYDDNMRVPTMLAIISQLRNQPGIYGSNKWNDICIEVGSLLELK